MSTFACPVVPITLKPHTNSDFLSVCSVHEYPIVVRTEDWPSRVVTGAYLPVDSLVPADRTEFEFLGEHRRIKAKKLRGIFSMGLLMPTPPGMVAGDDAADFYGVTKYEPPEPALQGGDQAPPPPIPVPEYTEIEHLRRYDHVFEPGVDVVLTEKIHGGQGKYLYHDGVLYAGSHHTWRREDPKTLYWRPVTAAFREFMATIPDCVVFGEIYGDKVQDLTYGAKPGQVTFRIFDVLDLKRGAYLGWIDLGRVSAIAETFGIGSVPARRVTKFDLNEILLLAEEDSVVGGPGHMSEGLVVRPLNESYNPEVGRVILKLPGQRYLLRRNA